MKFRRFRFAGISKERMYSGISEDGFTLIELLVAMALVSIFLGGLMAMFVGFSQAYKNENVKADIQQMARGGVEHIIPHSRLAGFDPGGQYDPLDPATHAAYDCYRDTCVGVPPAVADPTPPGIQNIGSTFIQFTADLNMDGYIDDSEDKGVVPRHSERITYRYNNGTQQVERILYEGTPAPVGPTPIVNNVTSFRLQYWDEDDNPTVNASDVEAVTITMTIREVTHRTPDGRLAQFIDRTYQNKVRIRNLTDFFKF